MYETIQNAQASIEKAVPQAASWAGDHWLMIFVVVFGLLCGASVFRKENWVPSPVTPVEPWSTAKEIAALKRAVPGVVKYWFRK